MEPSSKFVSLLAALVACAGIAAYMQLKYPAPRTIFSFKVPSNSRIALLWENEGTEKNRRIPLKAEPGDQVRVAIEKGTPGVLALDEIPEGFFLEVPEEKLEALPAWHGNHSNLKLVSVHDHPVLRSRFQFFWESFDHPILAELRKRERLDEVVAGAESEFERFRRLMMWTHGQWKEGKPDPYPPWNALAILDWIRAGKTGGFCAQYAQVLVQSLLSFGYQARYVSLANHEVLEAWSNQFAKWITLDPTDGVYYTKDGIPMNSHELSTAYYDGKTGEVTTVGAPTNAYRFKSYREFYVSTRNDHLSQGRAAGDYLRSMWKERVFLVTRHTKKLPYQEGKLRPVTPFVSDLYFPLNSTHLKMLRPVGKDRIEIWLETLTPGFDSFVRRSGEGNLAKVPPRYLWKLGPGRNEIRLYAMNRKGVLGPETRVLVELGDSAGIVGP